MDDLLTSRQVQDLLKVDRITVYRMLQDGRLKGLKIGQQWRFHQREVDRLLGAQPSDMLPALAVDASFPTHCIQAVQDLFSEISQIGSLVVNPQGEPLTRPSRSCALCRAIQSSPAGMAACRASWREIARGSGDGRIVFTCHAGLQYVAAPFVDQDQPVGLFLTGQFSWDQPDPREEAARLERLGQAYGLSAGVLSDAAREILLIPSDLHARVQAWPAAAALAVQSILAERLHFLVRLQQIANLTQI
jgi:excisionase family DNA binding protein